MKGYKIFNPDFTCIDIQFAENTEFKIEGKPVICQKGFHFCLKASDCFSYYDFDPKNIVCEVEALGETVDHTNDSKIATNHIKIGRKLSWQEVLMVANEGVNNSGYSNSGYSNSGNWNSGDRNSGDSNSGYRNSGAFCINLDPILFLFDKPSKMTVKEWEQHPACSLMYSIDTTIWVPWSIMSEEEKKANPKYEASEGYTKPIPIKEAWKNFWHNLTKENKKLFTSLENFDSKIFKEITGIKI